jgi:hypothetical protein
MNFHIHGVPKWLKAMFCAAEFARSMTEGRDHEFGGSNGIWSFCRQRGLTGSTRTC